MDIEVSLKIRSAIKAKLVELGCHVDEELPDYIMVLIANRRTRTHMEEDLQLFLGDNTTTFTVWLHHVLKKLEQITTTTTGKSSLFVSAGSSASAATAAAAEVEEAIAEIQSSNSAPSSDNLEQDEDKVGKKRRKPTESKRPKKSSKTIKIKKDNFESVENDDDLPAARDSRGSKPSLGAPKEENLNEGQGSEESDDLHERSKTSETSMGFDGRQFKVPSTSTKKTRISKSKAVKTPEGDDDDEDFDCLNLKAETDDLFLEPGSQQAKLKIERKRKEKPAPAVVPQVEQETEAQELELLRQKVLESTKRKRPLAGRLGAIVNNAVKSNLSSSVTNVREPSPNATAPDLLESESPESLAKADRKKISNRNIESLNRIIKSNPEVKRESKSEYTRSHSPKPRKSDDYRSSERHRSRHTRDTREEDGSDHGRLRSGHKRRSEYSRSPEKQPSKQLKSSIGSVINRIDQRYRYEKEEEYDPSCPEVNNKLQSIVKVPASRRKPQVSPETNKKLLFRAIADAEQSLLQTKQSKSRYEEKEEEMELKNMKNKKTYITRKSVHDRLGFMGDKKDRKNDEEEIEIVEEWEYAEDDDLEMSNYNNFEGDETIIINIPNESNIGRNVMLETKDGGDSQGSQRHHHGESYTGKLPAPKRISIQVHSDDDDDDSTTTDDDDNNNEINTSTNDTIYKSEDSNSNADGLTNDDEIILNESNTKLPSPDYQIGNESSDSYNSRFDLNGFSSTKKVVTRTDSKIQITVNNDSGPSSPVTAAALSPNPSFQSAFPVQLQQHQPQSQQQQCKFWPNCTFSDKCMYTHPTCKFNTKCTKPNCPYKHIGFRQHSAPHPKLLKPSHVHPVKPQAGGKGQGKTCIYFPKCHTLSCPYFHPTPCRFGTGCNDLKCSNYHPGVTLAKKKFNTTTKSKKDLFKWKAPTLTSGLAAAKPEMNPGTVDNGST